MTNWRYSRVVLAAVLAVILTAGIVVVTTTVDSARRTNLVGYFANSNGLFPGDEVWILGVPVGKVETIEPQPDRAKITFYVDDKYKVPADAKAVILSPSLVSSRAIQLTPVYTGGPVMNTDTVIPQERTAVPVEFDDFRVQLERLADTLQPTEPGGVSTLGAFVNTAADNLCVPDPDGGPCDPQGANIRDTVIKLSQAFSALGDHSDDLFSTVKNLSVLVSALQSSRDLLRELNQNLASVTGLLTNSPNEVGTAVDSLNSVVGDVTTFVADNRETLGTTGDQLAATTTTLYESLDDLKQTLHVAPNAFQNFLNIYQPAQGTLTGALAINNFSNPIQFLCGAVQAASRLGAEQSAKLCAQYLAPIIKNRQYNFPPLGINPFVGAQARPNEITYSEDWLRPDYVPPPAGSSPGSGGPLPPAGAPFTRFGEPAANPPADAPFVPSAPLPPPGPVDQSPPGTPVSTDPAAGLPGLMVPPGGGA
ncbi:mammalian cell entry protein [Mycolicibacterium duvalii]|uniref:Mce family protein Mce3D n=1 Tax=Mycolicibacterium duvalii TaxID=39688 RepID=A0A7I7JZ89_9MYCO|nr:MCE family protein [Mycolicibacterium duvalii]MCV7370941.1 MCE family protein [Mycolicibacterium duvalii]PEG41255.1 mammalian cell entry protein [Mycolicibacterium duvalii]BBX17196.1 Mce family protein Mce3D [Mycolicibacterium duvalii]